MIITAPTGLYRPLLPSSPSDSGNITFIISNNPPPRSNEVFLQLPNSELIRKEPKPNFDKEQKRIYAGKLIYDIIKSSSTSKGSGSRQYEIGEILEFEDADDDNIDSYNLKSISLRQDLKVIDYSLAGLNQEEVQELLDISLKKQNEITNEISKFSSELQDNGSLISLNQSSINNCENIYNSMVLVLGLDHSSVKKVEIKISELKKQKILLLSERSNLQLLLDNLRNELNIIREVVR